MGANFWQEMNLDVDGPNVGYATAHIWPQNWGWYNPNSSATYERAEQNALEYLRRHVFDMAVLNKPLVLEEFGLARDWQPVHETPGWYSVYNLDESTIAIISSHAMEMMQIVNP